MVMDPFSDVPILKRIRYNSKILDNSVKEFIISQVIINTLQKYPLADPGRRRQRAPGPPKRPDSLVFTY